MPTIKIFESKNSPWARLSDNFYQPMFINGFRWPTATNYIYANMLKSGLYRSYLRGAKPRSDCVGENPKCSQRVKGQIHCERTEGCKYSRESVRDQFLELYEREQKERLKNIFRAGLELKFAQNPRLATLLIATGKRPIIYNSPGEWLGIGKGVNGKNVYGKLLEELRAGFVALEKRRKGEVKREQLSSKVYEIYLAYTNLLHLINKGDDLSKYEGWTPKEILSKMQGRGIKISSELGEEVVMQEYSSHYGTDVRVQSGSESWLSPDIHIVLTNPKVLATLIRGSALEDLRKRQIRLKHQKVLHMFLYYLLEKDYKIDEDEYQQAIEEQLATITITEQAALGKETFILYEKGQLSARLSDKIDEAIAKIHVPSKRDVAKSIELAKAIRNRIGEKGAESGSVRSKITEGDIITSEQPEKESILSEILSGTEVKKDTQLEGKKRSEGGIKPVYIWPVKHTSEADDLFLLFSPLDETLPIRTPNHVYPSLAYFCFARQFGDIESNSDPYTMIRNLSNSGFQTIPALENKLRKLKEKKYAENLKENARVALQAKFKNLTSQDVLLQTRNKTLIWDDRSDPILGTGLPTKYNFIGRELVRIRAQLRTKRGKQKFSKLSASNIDQLFNNPFLSSWCRMRVNDMCNTIIVMKDYMWVKYKEAVPVTPGFVRQILDNIYQPCSHIFAANRDVAVTPPALFTRIIKSNRKFSSSISEKGDVFMQIVTILWERVAVLLQYLVGQLQNITKPTPVNVGVILKQIKSLTSREIPCQDTLSETIDNCILSAVLNLLERIVVIDKNFFHHRGEPTEVDLSAVGAIILGLESITEQRSRQREMQSSSTGSGTEEIASRKSIIPSRLQTIRDQLDGEGYSKTVINRVIEEIQNLGTIPSTNEINIVAESIKLDPESFISSTKDRGEDTPVAILEGKEKQGLVLNEADREKLVTRLKSHGLYVNAIEFTIEDIIAFIRMYPIYTRVKTNRINFFATLDQ